MIDHEKAAPPVLYCTMLVCVCSSYCCGRDNPAATSRAGGKKKKKEMKGWEAALTRADNCTLLVLCAMCVLWCKIVLEVVSRSDDIEHRSTWIVVACVFV